jgi:hypothetical protein
MTTTYRLPIQIKHVLLKWPVEEYRKYCSDFKGKIGKYLRR